MFAAESGALPRGKVGGMGDVIRDVPIALAELGHQVHVVLPGYQYFSTLSAAQHVAEVGTVFAGQVLPTQLYSLPGIGGHKRVRYWVLEHPDLAPRTPGEIYSNDTDGRPFAIDGKKFALFCAAAAQTCVDHHFGDLDIVHLHDWHTALMAVLFKYDPRYQAMADTPLVYTIHNLALQGIRPFSGDDSSLHHWFPSLTADGAVIADPRYHDCVNPMRAAINLCDRIHAVSPSYAKEIQQPSDYPHGRYGGEGLEGDLSRAQEQGRLQGILNGCEYGNQHSSASLIAFLQECPAQVLAWAGQQSALNSAHFIATQRINQWLSAFETTPATVLTSVGRLTDQKVRMLREPVANGMTLLDQILELLGDDGVLIMLGSGDGQLEAEFTKIAGRRDNLLFLNGYSESLSAQLYALGDLFLMPSSFEPCGISQMLAMREGQPCLVNAVGGLNDTVIDGENGFVFKGDSLQQQGQALISKLREALAIKAGQAKQWHQIGEAASKARFLWQDAAQQYSDSLYNS